MPPHAEHYHIQIASTSLKKDEFRVKIATVLVELGVPRESSLPAEEPDLSESVKLLGSKTEKVQLQTQGDQSVRLQELELQFKIKQMEAKDREEVRKLEMERLQLGHEEKMKELEFRVRSETGTASFHTASVSPPRCDVGRNISLVPPFSEKDVEKYFSHFERVTTTLEWPKHVWTLLLPCALTGEAQELYSALTLTQSSDYEVVKAAILSAYELVSEVYRQRFRG